jgi:hypothetical protein
MYDIEGVGFRMATREYTGKVRLMIKLYGKLTECLLPIESNSDYGGVSIARLVAKMLRQTVDELDELPSRGNDQLSG